MAIVDFGQLVLNVRPHPTYEDGDVLCAFSRCHIQHVHIQHICRPRDARGKTPGGMLGENTLTEYYLAQVSQYRFERVSKYQVSRVQIADGATQIFGRSKNDKGEQIYVVQFLARRKKAGKLPIFGPRGAEVWYGGRTSIVQPTLDTVWNEIEQRTLYRRANHEHWPMTPIEKRQFLGISVDDFAATEAGELVAPLLADPIGDEPPEQLKRRKNKINWRDLTGVVSADILDAEKTVDVRADFKHVRGDIVREKVRA